MTAPLRAGPTVPYVHMSFIHQCIISQSSKAFQAHVKKVLASDELKKAEQNAQPFFKDVRDFVFGRPTTMENMVRTRMHVFLNDFLTYFVLFPVQRKLRLNKL